MTEVVEVETVDGQASLFCKHGHGYIDVYPEHRRGPDYEADVYGRVVAPIGCPAPGFVGAFAGEHGVTLVLEHLGGVLRLHESSTPAEHLIAAASVLGAVHARCRHHVPEARRAGLNEYSHRFFAVRLRDLAAVGPPESSCDARGAAIPVDAAVAALANADATVIHGELFTSNVLIDSGGTISFVDWETCGPGPGELDLAALVSGGWTSETRAACETAYAAARFGGTPPTWFTPALDAAKLFVLLLFARHSTFRGRDPFLNEWFGDQLHAAVEVGRR